MTAHYIAKVVESLYNKLDIDKMSATFKDIKQYNEYGNVTDEWVNRHITEKTYFRWCEAIGVLERYCQHNFATFKETELVYKWAKDVCEHRNRLYNQWRAFGGYSTFEQWVNKNW